MAWTLFSLETRDGRSIYLLPALNEPVSSNLLVSRLWNYFWYATRCIPGGEGHSRMISKASKFFAMSLLLVSVSALADSCNNFNICTCAG